MPIYKRGGCDKGPDGRCRKCHKKRGTCGVYWYNFWFEGRHIQESTKQGNPKKARDMEAKRRAALADGIAGIRKRQRITLAEFIKNEFLPFVESKFAGKPNTLRYYRYGASELKECSFTSLHLDEINDSHGASYATKRTNLSPSTVNCVLRTLRRALALAYQWGKLDRPAKITLAKGERQRERVLTDVEVAAYLAACPQPWRDAATIMLGTGMRPSEVFSLRWEIVHLNGKSGVLQITQGKSRAAKRMLPLVPVVYAVFRSRHDAQGQPETGWVFPADTPSGHLEGYCAKNQHAVALKTIEETAREKGMELPVRTFPPYTLRHTALTRLAEAGCDAFTLARIAGHSSITITQRYCHPQADAIERAFAKLPESTSVAGGK